MPLSSISVLRTLPRACTKSSLKEINAITVLRGVCCCFSSLKPVMLPTSSWIPCHLEHTSALSLSLSLHLNLIPVGRFDFLSDVDQGGSGRQMPEAAILKGCIWQKKIVFTRNPPWESVAAWNWKKNLGKLLQLEDQIPQTLT